MADFSTEYARYFRLTEDALPRFLPDQPGPWDTVVDAMRYSLLGGGKRIRAVLALSVCEICGGRLQDVLPFACAIEMIHAYSLIHDDLPCMDNDDLRRGKPSCHIRFGEGMAVLAGDALLTRAFETALSLSAGVSGEIRLKAAQELAAAAGTGGMIGGQVMDIECEGKPMDTAQLDRLNGLKTGALIRASVRIGCIAADVGEQVLAAADAYAARLGLVFQITDDILDVSSTAAVLGKPIDSDSKREKETYASLLGTAGAASAAQALAAQAVEAVHGTVLDHPFLRNMASYFASRDR